MPAHIVGRHVLQLLSFPDGGAIAEYIKPAEAVESRLYKPSGRLLIREIGLNRNGFNTVTLKMSHRLRGFRCGGSIVNDKGIAALRERVGNVPTETALAAAGDES